MTRFTHFICDGCTRKVDGGDAENVLRTFSSPKGESHLCYNCQKLLIERYLEERELPRLPFCRCGGKGYVRSHPHGFSECEYCFRGKLT